MADAHMRNTFICHNGTHVSKVQIDYAGLGNQIRNALYALPQDFVRLAERFCQCCFFVNDAQKTLVRNNNERIHTFLQFRNASFRIHHSLFALKIERLCHHTNRQDSQFLGNRGDSRRSASTRTAAHTGSNEHHIRAAQSLRNLVLCFFYRFFANIRVAACAKTLCQLFTYLYLCRRL